MNNIQNNVNETTRSHFKIKPFVLSNIVKKYINLENEKNRKIRELKDTTTKCFVNIFFDSTDILCKFVFWVYHKINCKLLEIQKAHCVSDEKIIFFFKGGNIMFLWRKKFEEIYGGVNKDIASKTAISDCDFAIYILTKDERRFNIIYSHINSVLIAELEEIGAMFDELFIKVSSNTRNKTNNNARISNMINQEFNCDTFKRNEKKIFNNFFKDFYTKEKVIRFLADVKSELNKLKGVEFYEEKNYEIFKYTIPDTFDIQVNGNRQSLILRPEDKVPNSFSLIDFSNQKLHYVTVNANIFNNLSKAGHLIGFDLYRIKFNTIINSILKSKKYPNSNNFNGPNIQMDFGIPSEFIDISVSKYYDLNLQKLREDFYNGQNRKTLLSNKFASIGFKFSDGSELPQSILTMQMKYIVDDLLVTLFSQNQHNPMIDPKYEKRLFRVFFFYILNNLLKKRKIVPYGIFDSIDSGNTFYQHFLSPNDNLGYNYIKNMKGKMLYNFFNIKSQFNDLRYLLQFTILFNKIIGNDDLLSEFILYYNDIYNIIDNNKIDDFRIKFAKFKTDLSDNYKKAYDYFNLFINIKSHLKQAGGMKKQTNTNHSNANTNDNGQFSREVSSLYKILGLNKTQILNKLFDIGGGVTLEYKDIDLQIGYEERTFYPSFEFDDDM